MFHSVGTPLYWIGFFAFIFVMLALDLGVFHKKNHEITLKEAGIWTAVWVGLAGCMAVFVYFRMGSTHALEFVTGYVLEEALSVDNIFVFILLFKTFGIPRTLQHRVLFWGILGALVMRITFILAGGAFVQRFEWAMYVFGAILVYTGGKIMFGKDEEERPQDNPVVKFMGRLIPSTKTLRDGKFFVREGGKLLATPLFTTLIAVEISDVIFAVDSIPAIFAVTTDPFIVFTSNICAIMGLRSMYFLLAAVIERFHYLQLGLSVVLIFIGGKLIAHKYVHVPIYVSLGVILVVLAGAIVFSIMKPPVVPEELSGASDTPGGPVDS